MAEAGLIYFLSFHFSKNQGEHFLANRLFQGWSLNVEKALNQINKVEASLIIIKFQNSND